MCFALWAVINPGKRRFGSSIWQFRFLSNHTHMESISDMGGNYQMHETVPIRELLIWVRDMSAGPVDLALWFFLPFKTGTTNGLQRTRQSDFKSARGNQLRLCAARKKPPIDEKSCLNK
jgi:hypothetical protein